MPDPTPSPQALAAEFDMLTARAGLTIPPDRRAGLIEAFADMRAQLPLLHTPRSHPVELANVFRLTPAPAK